MGVSTYPYLIAIATRGVAVLVSRSEVCSRCSAQVLSGMALQTETCMFTEKSFHVDNH